jgi:hypothetical protein
MNECSIFTQQLQIVTRKAYNSDKEKTRYTSQQYNSEVKRKNQTTQKATQMKKQCVKNVWTQTSRLQWGVGID